MRARRELEWRDENDVWIARTHRSVGSRYKISVRHLEDGEVFDVHCLVRTGPEVWRPRPTLAAATTLERAQELAGPALV